MSESKPDVYVSRGEILEQLVRETEGRPANRNLFGATPDFGGYDTSSTCPNGVGATHHSRTSARA